MQCKPPRARRPLRVAILGPLGSHVHVMYTGRGQLIGRWTRVHTCIVFPLFDDLAGTELMLISVRDILPTSLCALLYL